jgi:hypothetical protein
MKLYQIIEWFKTNFMDIILSQRKTLGYLVYGLMNSQKVGIASIGFVVHFSFLFLNLNPFYYRRSRQTKFDFFIRNSFRKYGMSAM